MRKPNSLKRRIKAGEIVFGPWCVIPSPSIINIIGAAGMDFRVTLFCKGAFGPLGQRFDDFYGVNVRGQVGQDGGLIAGTGAYLKYFRFRGEL